MATLSKRKKLFLEKIDVQKSYALEDAMTLLKECSKAVNDKFDQTVEMHVRLGVDPKKSDQAVRSSAVLPNGTGKTVRVAVFAEGPDADKAKAAGADIVGSKDLAEKIKQGDINFEILIATPSSMREVGKLGPLLGPKGLMPNPKDGTVTTDVEKAVKNAKSGQVQYRVDKAGIVHVPVGKLSFDSTALIENLNTLIADMKKAKPSSSKGVYLKKIVLSSTMGPGIRIDHSTVSAA